MQLKPRSGGTWKPGTQAPVKMKSGCDSEGAAHRARPKLMPHILLFTQPGCFSCELMRVYLEARGIAFEELDISKDSEARRVMTETYGSNETPTMLIDEEVIIGFDPGLLDQILDSPASSDSVN
jgi:glutaredoxin